MKNATLESKVKNLGEKAKSRNKKWKLNWKKLLLAFSMMVIVGISGFLIYENGFSYEVSLNGSNVGYIKEEELLDETLDMVEKDIKDEYGEDAYFIKETETERVRGHNKELVELEELRERISGEIEILKPASIITIDGKEEIIVRSEKAAMSILNEIKRPYKESQEENVEILEVDFSQDVDIIKKDVPVDLIYSEKEGFQALGRMTGGNMISKADTKSTRSSVSRFARRDLEEEESEDPSRIILDIVSREKHKSMASIDFETEEKDDSSIYVGEKKVDQEGENGEKEIFTEITYINGEETEREIIEEVITKEPKNKIILKGTKEKPKPAPAKKASKSTNNSRSINSSIGSSIVATARRYLGTPYRYGGSSPSGFDCSGFTSYVYRQNGISIPRTSGGQGSCGRRIPRSQLQPGDIVSFPGHVGIYVGSGNFIHSPNSGRTVEIRSLSSYNNRFLGGRRPY